MSEFKLTTVEEFEAATEPTVGDRREGRRRRMAVPSKESRLHTVSSVSMGVCCRICAMGPCRITPKAPRGICGCDAHGIVARNYLRFTAGGAATHSDHGREICHHPRTCSRSGRRLSGKGS